VSYEFRFRTLRNFKDPMFLSARIVDKFIAGGGFSVVSQKNAMIKMRSLDLKLGNEPLL